MSFWPGSLEREATAAAATDADGPNIEGMEGVVLSGVWLRPRKTTISSSLDALDATEGDGEALRIVICARASELSGEAGAAVTSSEALSLMVPSRRPALTKVMGIWRSFLPASNAVERWPDVKRASSASENVFAPVAAVKVNETAQERRKARTELAIPPADRCAHGCRAACGCARRCDIWGAPLLLALAFAFLRAMPLSSGLEAR